MKFMVSWQIPMENRAEAFKGFSQMTAADDKADHGDNVRLIASRSDGSGQCP